MEEMKKDENLETQETVVEETAETVEAEVVEEGEVEIVDEKDEKIAALDSRLLTIWINIRDVWRSLITSVKEQ